MAAAASDERRAVLAPLIGEARPKGKPPPPDLRRAVEAVVRRHRDGAARRGAARPTGSARAEPGRSRGGFGTKACAVAVVAAGAGRAVAAFAVAPGQAHGSPIAAAATATAPTGPAS